MKTNQTRSNDSPSNGENRARLPALLAGALVLAIALLILPMAQPAYAQSGITSPSPGSTLSGDVPVIGTAIIEPFQKYELHYKLEPNGDDAFVYFDGNTSPVSGGQLGVWRAGALPAGTYSLRLRVVKQDGNYAEFFSPNLSVNQGAAAAPTSATPTETPTPSEPTPTFTPAPSATPNVGAVQQPQLDQAATPTPAAVAVAPADPNALPAAGSDPNAPVVVQPGDLAAGQSSAAAGAIVEPEAASSNTRQLGEALSLDRLRTEFARGIRISAAVFLVAFGVFAGKRTFDWARRRYG